METNGLPPMYEVEVWRPGRGWRAVALLGALAVVLLVTSALFGILGPPSGSPWVCWIDQANARQCAPQAPSWMLVDQA